jgi:solute carrier family 35 protein C2
LQLLPPSTHTHTSADVTQKPLTKHEPGLARAVTSGAVDAAAPYDSPPPSVEAPAAVETAAAETAPAAGGASGLVSVATGAATGDLAIGAIAAAAWRGDLPPVQVPVPLVGDGRRLGMESRGAVSGAVLAGEHAAEAVQRQEHMVGVVMVLIAALCSGLRWATLQLLLQAPVDAQRGPREQLEPLSPLLVTLRTAPFGVALLLPLALVLEYDEMETFGRRAAAAGLSSVEMGTAVVDESTVQPQMAFGALLALLVGGGMLAFLMLLCELRVVQLASGLTLSVLGVLKEVLTVGASVILFGDTITTLKAAGLGLCVIGIGLYQRIQR